MIAYILFWLQDGTPEFKVGVGASSDLSDKGLYSYYDGSVLYAYRGTVLLGSLTIAASYAAADYLELWVETEGDMGYFYISIVDDDENVIGGQSVGLDLPLDPEFDVIGDFSYFEIYDPTTNDLGMVDYFEAICPPGA